jgi:spoIIIJ-associated protein
MPMQKIEVRAGSVAEAVAQALAQLGKDEDEALIEVLSQTADSALVRVSVDDDTEGEDEGDTADAAEPAARRRRRRVPNADEDTVEMARSILEDLLKRMEIEAFVTPVVQTVEGPDGEPEQNLTLHIEGVDEETTGLMIGRRGETLRSIQYLLNLLIHRQGGRWPQVVIDIGQYRQRRQDSLEGLAMRMAERVRQSGRPMPLEPMSSFERRVIHMVLRNDPSVYTESSGEGEHRKIVIFPNKNR